MTNIADEEGQVNELLSLKQQQASVVQAYESVRQAEETVRQGRAIMVFTIFTIIFLPLSFMSSVFSMNNVEFGDGTTFTLQGQFQLMGKLPACPPFRRSGGQMG